MLGGILSSLLSLCERRTASPWLIERAARLLDRSVLPRVGGGTIRRLQLARLRQTMTHVGRRSPFYRDVFERLRVRAADFRTLDDLAKLPFTTSDDIRDWRRFLCVPEQELGAVFTTSGTTGEPKRVYFTRRELQVSINWAAVALRFRRPGRLVALIALPMSHGLWIGSAMAQRAIERAGGLPLPVGVDDPQETLHWLKRFEPNLVISSPSYFSVLTRLAERQSFRAAIDRVLLSGEPLSPLQRQVFKSYWHADVLDTYGATELGGGQTIALPGCTAFHLNELSLHTEIIDPDSGTPAEEGELVFTTLTREAMPLVRYRFGDRARWSECGCGLPFRAVRILGRTNHSLVAGDMLFYTDLLSQAVAQVPGASGRLSLIIDKVDLIDRLRVQVEGNGVDEKEVRRCLIGAYPDLPMNLSNGNLLLEIEPDVSLARQLKSVSVRDTRGATTARLTG